MEYPTLDEVAKSSRTQLARWNRFLPSPGMNSIDLSNFEEREEILEKEVIIMQAILVRLKQMGGINPQISKEIGW